MATLQDGTLLNSGGLDLEPRTEREVTLALAIKQSRKSWRSLYGRFYQLRHENTVRRPSWRVEMETSAWRAMRAEVRRNGELRAQRRNLTSIFGNFDTPEDNQREREGEK